MVQKNTGGNGMIKNEPGHIKVGCPENTLHSEVII
jgi:hypothetical protein